MNILYKDKYKIQRMRHILTRVVKELQNWDYRFELDKIQPSIYLAFEF